MQIWQDDRVALQLVPGNAPPSSSSTTRKKAQFETPKATPSSSFKAIVRPPFSSSPFPQLQASKPQTPTPRFCDPKVSRRPASKVGYTPARRAACGDGGGVGAGQVQARVPGRPGGGQDGHHHPLHVRQVRRHLPGDDRDRLPVQDDVPRRPHRSPPALGHSWAGEVPQPDPELHQRLLRGRHRLRCHRLMSSFFADSQSFLNTSKWIEEVNTQRGGDVLIFLVGNKTDLVDKRKVTTGEGEAKAREHGAMFIETSAKAGFNVKPLFRKIAGSLPGLDALSSAKHEDMVDINLRPASGSSASGAVAQLEQKSGGCSC